MIYLIKYIQPSLGRACPAGMDACAGLYAIERMDF
jgi:hypothetical protein